MKSLVLLALAATLAAPALAAEAPLKIGDTAPDFALRYATRDSVASDSLRLSTLRAKGNVVLAFYPADWSGGCTKEVCTFRDNLGTLSALKAEVVGVSGDYVFSHHEWAKFHSLPFRLASDHDHAVAKLYRSFNPANGYNQRTVFVVDPEGKIRYVDMAYSTRDATSFEKLKAFLEGKS